MWRRFGKRSARTRLKDLLASIEQARDDATRLRLDSTTKLLEMAELSVIEDLERPSRNAERAKQASAEKTGRKAAQRRTDQAPRTR
ncbi:MAG: hypothetical protein AAGF81_22780 [Pseudomonadota bacterium]